ncbi:MULTISPECIES: universal stress protein [Flavobacterium]|uniref:Universal stress protein n=3 Tax=Flavobacterium TaxID=237 RepID=A0A4R5CUY6_9FLAO|nr:MULTISPECIES: universal stress protein [Flavobacterium]PIF62627.1 nucleotide-binding universal stress UspA family protein [Flavobacterium sp. 11]RBN49017.1 universal stress protein [Flavobacterium psychrolimnae]TDD77222.1 universal stress protein [Flavobacterium caseinilyticum]TDE04236.1 universal stress protein [Flavobacterium sandaracinum]WKL43854.1 universal stress protein [Flavobacterium sp. ZE23DGlu08]
MDKILVTTDFSSNSKAGLRFAIQLASQHKFELTFFHSYYMANLTSLSNLAFADYERKEADKIQKKLNQFVASVYRDMDVVSINKKCIINSAVLADSNIREYAQENKFSFICISTRGSGKLKKIFGTNTSSLISHSTVPVIAVPQNYRRSEIKSVIYASDLVNLENELKKVIEFTKPLKAKVEILHFNFPAEITTNKNTIDELVKKNSKHNIKLHIENINLAKSLISNIEAVIKQSKPSMMIMFTQQNRSFFDKIFFSSNSANYSFKAKVPLLVFNKI